MKNIILFIILSLTAIVPIALALVSPGVSYWSFNNRTGFMSNSTNTTDEWLNHNGSIVGPLYSPDIGYGSSGSYWFDGDDDYILLGNISEISENGPCSISFWQYSNDSDGVILAHNGPGGGGILSISSTSTQIYGTEYFYTGSVNWEKTWHHVVFSWNGDSSTAKLYVDTTLYDVHVSSGANDMPELKKFIVGYSMNSLNGTIDEVKIYDRELTQSEVNELYGITETETESEDEDRDNGELAFLLSNQKKDIYFEDENENTRIPLLLLISLLGLWYYKKTRKRK